MQWQRFGIGSIIILGFIGGFIWWQQHLSTQSQSSSQETEKATYAPDFTLTSLDGKTIRLTDYEGKKPVILDFWATWCPDCRRNLPELNILYHQYRDAVEVIAINLQEPEGIVREYLREEYDRFLFPIVLDPDDVVSRTYGNPATNTHFLIRKDGTIMGILPGDMTEELIKQLIAP